MKKLILIAGILFAGSLTTIESLNAQQRGGNRNRGGNDRHEKVVEETTVYMDGYRDGRYRQGRRGRGDRDRYHRRYGRDWHGKRNYRGRRPSVRHVWADGYWRYNRRIGRKVWISGRWIVRAPQRVWVPGCYTWNGRRRVWSPGYWEIRRY